MKQVTARQLAEILYNKREFPVRFFIGENKYVAKLAEMFVSPVLACALSTDSPSQSRRQTFVRDITTVRYENAIPQNADKDETLWNSLLLDTLTECLQEFFDENEDNVWTVELEE